MAETVPINVLDVAKRVLSAPEQLRAITSAEVVALCGFVLQQNDLPVSWPTWTVPSLGAMPADLAVSATHLLTVFEHRRQLFDDWWETSGLDRLEAEIALDGALKDFKTRFEKEFPNV